MDKRNNIEALNTNIIYEKKKGFTLIEIMVVLAITVIITLTIYTFYNSNSRTLTNAEAKSTLQLEGNQIQKDLLNYGTQAKSIDVTADGGVNTIKFTVYGDGVTDVNDLNTNSTSVYVFELSNPHQIKDTTVYDMKIYKDGTDVSTVQARSTHVQSIEVNNLDTGSGSNINDSSSVQITINLYIKKGLNEVKYPVTTIVKLRNKNV